jgi:membrane protease YdiL (CAAX protease family)
MRNTPPALPSTFRVASLVVRFAIRRWANRLRALRRRKSARFARGPTGRKRPAGRVLAAFVSLALLLSAGLQTEQLVVRIATSAQRLSQPDFAVVSDHTLKWILWAERQRADESRAKVEYGDWRAKLHAAFEHEVFRMGIREPPASAEQTEQLERLFNDRGASAFRAEAGVWYREGDSEAMRRPLGIVAFLLALSVVLFSVSGTSQDLARIEWTFEWWFTFPVPARGLLLAKVLETALASPLVWFLLFPFFSIVFWCSGYSWVGIGIGLAATIYVGLLAGSLQVVAETSLRRFLSLRNLSRVQAVLSILSPVVLFSVVATVSPEWLAAVIATAARLPSWSRFNPLTLPIEITAGGVRAAYAALGCASAAFAAVACATTMGGWFLRDGLVTAGGPLQGTRHLAAEARASRAQVGGGMTRNELRRLTRDRTAFVQVLVMPAVLVGFQLLINPGLLRAASASARHSVAIAFAAAAVVLSTGACNCLVVDVPVLWLYLTLPRSLERLLIDKALFWSGLGLAAALAVLVAIAGAHPAVLLRAVPLIVLTAVGIVLYGFIATAIGVLGTDPLETEPRRRIQVSMIYLFMLLASMFMYALYTPSIWAKIAQVLLSALLAFGLWQKVSDHAPYLLDPTEAPRPNIAVADGVIAALAFFVLQGLLVLGLGAIGWSPGAGLLFGFAGAGLVVSVAALFTFWRIGVPNLLSTLGLGGSSSGPARALVAGVAGGLAGGAFARGYLWVVAHVDFLRRISEETFALGPERTREMMPWLIVLGVVAAPIFEEFIFRAVLFGGFRRSLGSVRAGVASALIFGIVHPPIGSVPVFVLGLIAALVYDRSRSLLAPVAAHMTYNAMVLWFALGSP